MKKMMIFLLTVALVLGCMSPVEAEAKTKKKSTKTTKKTSSLDYCPYEVGGILGGKIIVSVENFIYDGYSRGFKITLADGTYARYTSLGSLCYGNLNNLEYDTKYLVLRTDFSDGLIDLDANGIDDRDPLNTTGVKDTNFNCVVDGAPLLHYGYVNDWRSEPYLMYYTHCKHNVVKGSYLLGCPACAEEMKGMPKWG